MTIQFSVILIGVTNLEVFLQAIARTLISGLDIFRTFTYSLKSFFFTLG